jgi:DNA helicase-2/ATP-dependent DNA helicase PcrA
MKWLTPRFSRKKDFSWSKKTEEPIPFRKPKDTGSGFRIGQNVVHPKFGSGVIVDAEGSGGDARVQVNFGNQGVKWLAVAVAKLQAA